MKWYDKTEQNTFRCEIIVYVHVYFNVVFLLKICVIFQNYLVCLFEEVIMGHIGLLMLTCFHMGPLGPLPWLSTGSYMLIWVKLNFQQEIKMCILDFGLHIIASLSLCYIPTITSATGQNWFKVKSIFFRFVNKKQF